MASTGSTGYDSQTATLSASVDDFTFAIDIANLSSDANIIDGSHSAGTGLIRFQIPGASGTSVGVRVYVDADGSYAASDTYGSDNAYNSGWEAYWPEGGGSDRTSNSNDLTAFGSPTVGGVAGQVGSGTDYSDAQSSYIESAVVSGPACTFMAWFKPANDTHNGTMVSVSDFSTTARYLGLFNRGGEAGDYLQAVSRNTNFAGPTTTSGFTASAWNHGACTFDTGTDATVYLDAANTASSSGLETVVGIDNTEIGGLGRGNTHNQIDSFVGVLNEVQIHSAARSADWIATEYDQTNDNATFWGSFTWTSLSEAASSFTGIAFGIAPIATGIRMGRGL